MRLSVSLTSYSWPGPISDELSAIARDLDSTAVDTLWVADHLLQADPSSDPTEPMLEAYTTLGFLAAQTARLRLGTLVTAATFRAPALLIKAVTTLDVLSRGRAWLGIGAGYHAGEATALGLFMPETGERFARTTELLRLARHMWSGGESAFVGDYLRLENPVAQPRPITSPGPPVLIGGAGERRTLRLVAEYADACNVFDIPDGGRTLRRKFDVLARHCAEVGRPFDEIERTVTTALGDEESTDLLTHRCERLGELGAQHVVVIRRGAAWSLADSNTVAEAARRVSSL